MFRLKNLRWKIGNFFPLTVFIFIFISGCTTEADIRRDQMIKNLSIQMVQNQRLSSDTTLQLHDIKHRLGMLTGEVEERGHRLSMTQESKTQEFQGQLDLLRVKVGEQSKYITLLQTRVKDQKQYITKVINSLSTLNKTSNYSNLSSYDKAMKDYRNKKYKKAFPQLVAQLNTKSVNGKRKARVYHNLGMISYMQGKYGDAKTYFSKLITKYPKVSYNANGLLFLARSFKKSKQKKEAKQTYQMLIEKFPKTSSAKHAKADLKKL